MSGVVKATEDATQSFGEIKGIFFSGGGYVSHAEGAALSWGWNKYFSSTGDLAETFSDVTVSTNSGGGWFVTDLLYSDKFAELISQPSKHDFVRQIGEYYEELIASFYHMTVEDVREGTRDGSFDALGTRDYMEMMSLYSSWEEIVVGCHQMYADEPTLPVQNLNWTSLVGIATEYNDYRLITNYEGLDNPQQSTWYDTISAYIDFTFEEAGRNPDIEVHIPTLENEWAQFCSVRKTSKSCENHDQCGDNAFCDLDSDWLVCICHSGHTPSEDGQYCERCVPPARGCVPDEEELSQLWWGTENCQGMQDGWNVCINENDVNHADVMNRCPATCAIARGQCTDPSAVDSEDILSIDGCSIESPDLASFKVESVEECRGLCDSHDGCEVFTYFDEDWDVNCNLRDVNGDYCADLCAAEDACDWTQQWSCPWDSPGSEGRAAYDGTIGFECCCSIRQSNDEPCGGSPKALFYDTAFSEGRGDILEMCERPEGIEMIWKRKGNPSAQISIPELESKIIESVNDPKKYSGPSSAAISVVATYVEALQDLYQTLDFEGSWETPPMHEAFEDIDAPPVSLVDGYAMDNCGLMGLVKRVQEGRTAQECRDIQMRVVGMCSLPEISMMIQDMNSIDSMTYPIFKYINDERIDPWKGEVMIVHTLRLVTLFEPMNGVLPGSRFEIYAFSFPHQSPDEPESWVTDRNGVCRSYGIGDCDRNSDGREPADYMPMLSLMPGRGEAFEVKIGTKFILDDMEALAIHLGLAEEREEEEPAPAPECTVLDGTPCTGWYYDTRCDGDSCCQGTNYDGYGWCGTGSGPGDREWGRCTAACNDVPGFDQADYASDAERANAIQLSEATVANVHMTFAVVGSGVKNMFAVIGVLSILYFGISRVMIRRKTNEFTPIYQETQEC